MSQVLQCTQLAALICRRSDLALSVPVSSTISYTLAGQKRVQGLPYSTVQRSTQTLVSATCRGTGWSSSCSVAAKYTDARRSRGGNERSIQPGARGDVAFGPGRSAFVAGGSSLSSDDQSAWFFSVHGDSQTVTVSHAALNKPRHRPPWKPGRMLRTFFSSAAMGEARRRASKPAPVCFSAKCSAASMPERLAWCVALILGTLIKPAASPI